LKRKGNIKFALSLRAIEEFMITFDITIPVLNEEATLRQQVLQLYAFVKEHYPNQGQWRIVIADNGSSDATPELATQLSQEHPEIVLVRVPERGVGLALKTSWTQSQADIVGYMDLDLATDLKYFLGAIQVLTEDGYDLVYASRLHPHSKVIGRTMKREVTSRIFNMMLRNYLHISFSDGMCGFKWLRRKHLPALMEGGAVSNGWFFSTELLTVAEWQHLKMYELPVTWTDDAGSSKVNIIRLAKQYTQAMRVLKQRKPK
jgi:glycosyltransferase involved in cell wall biosynthesis